MARVTSIDTYRRIDSEGLLSPLRFKVYTALYMSGPSTAREIHAKYFKEMTRDTISPRFAELERAGVIESIGTKTCEVSGNLAILWRTNDELPKKVIKPIKIKCPHCDGKGHLSEETSR
jgi:hypothetical protein